SHAVAYSQISYQLAYLKTHYPAVFFAELLSSAVNQQDKADMYIKELKASGLSLAPPSINKSFGKYTVENQQIRMGFQSIKGIGHQAIKEIIRVRQGGLFSSLFDFCLRVSLSVINRKTLETLVMAGAFDEVYGNRASLLASIDQALEQGELFKEFSGQSSLFQDKLDLEENYVAIEDFSLMKKLADEKELLGIYVSSHPFNNYREVLEANDYITMLDAEKMEGKRNLKSAGIVQTIRSEEHTSELQSPTRRSYDLKLDLEENYVAIEDFSLMKKLADEKELLGIYVSSHPFNNYREVLEANDYITMLDAEKMEGKRNLKSAGIVQTI